MISSYVVVVGDSRDVSKYWYEYDLGCDVIRGDGAVIGIGNTWSGRRGLHKFDVNRFGER